MMSGPRPLLEGHLLYIGINQDFSVRSPYLPFVLELPAFLPPFTLDSYIEHRRTLSTPVIYATAVARLNTIQ